MQAVEPYQMLACYGNMDPECEEWLVVTVVLPRGTSAILQKSLEQDYKLHVTLCEGRAAAEELVKAHPAWD